MKLRFIIFAALFMLVGCSKETEPPIIEPGSYYPVYPNSWWKYLVNDSLIRFDTTSDDYMVHSFKIDGEPDRYSDPARVPFLNGKPIYGYYFVEEVYMPTTPYQGVRQLWPILSETVGFTFCRWWVDARMGNPQEMVTVKSITIDGNDTILLLESHWDVWKATGSIYTEKGYRRYLKNVGLVSEYYIDTATSDTVSKKILIDYYVNHQ